MELPDDGNPHGSSERWVIGGPVAIVAECHYEGMAEMVADALEAAANTEDAADPPGELDDGPENDRD